MLSVNLWDIITLCQIEVRRFLQLNVESVNDADIERSHNKKIPFLMLARRRSSGYHPPLCLSDGIRNCPPTACAATHLVSQVTGGNSCPRRASHPLHPASMSQTPSHPSLPLSASLYTQLEPVSLKESISWAPCESETDFPSRSTRLSLDPMFISLGVGRRHLLPPRDMHIVVDMYSCVVVMV